MSWWRSMCWRRSSRLRSAIVLLSLKFSGSLIIHVLLFFKNSTLSIFMFETSRKVGPISCCTSHLLSGKFNGEFKMSVNILNSLPVPFFLLSLNFHLPFFCFLFSFHAFSFFPITIFLFSSLSFHPFFIKSISFSLFLLSSLP